MKYRFQHFVDISTSAESMQVLTFNVGGDDVIKRCAHLFNAYKYFRLGKISIKFVPASTLPVDPLGMSYAEDDPQTVDPRDQLNPGLVRITNGEDIFTDVSALTDEQAMGMYEAMMLDPRWYKFNLQSGFKRSAMPLYWEIGQLHQDQWPGSTINIPVNTSSTVLDAATTTAHEIFGTIPATTSGTTSSLQSHYTVDYSSDRGIFQVGHRGRIGWLPTDAYQTIWGTSAADNVAMVHPVPCIRVITAVLPKAYKTLYYYRCYITEEISFSGLRTIAPGSEISGTEYLYRGIDNFLQPPSIYANPPTLNYPIPNPAGNTRSGVNKMNDGTNEND